MDEPFSNLDADLKESIREELGVILKKANISCIMVTHIIVMMLKPFVIIVSYSVKQTTITILTEKRFKR